MVFSNIKRSLAGPGYVILNAIRVMNIISLGAVMAASVVTLIRNLVVSQFFFFDAISHIVTFFLASFLIISELGLFKSYFARNWPLLSLTHGFVTLGALMIFTAAQTLGSLNKKESSQDSLGLPFWQVIVASGVVCFIMGFVNVAASYLFRTRAVGVTARMVRAYGATAPQRAADVYYAANSAAMKGTPAPTTAAATPSVRTVVTANAHGSPRRSFSAPGHDGLPSYHPPEMRRAGSALGGRAGLNISGPVPHHPEQFDKYKGSPGAVERPATAAHPAFQGGRF